MLELVLLEGPSVKPLHDRRKETRQPTIDRRKHDDDIAERISGGIRASIRSVGRAGDRPAGAGRKKK